MLSSNRLPKINIYYFGLYILFILFFILFTTPDPGDKLVLMYGFTDNPDSTAFFARRPAEIEKHIYF